MREAVPSKKLDFWITHNYNVLLEGKHGVGKTACVIEAFKQHNIKYLYFSCSTLDPWVDLVGIPKEFTDPQTGTAYLDLVRPRPFAFDDVEVIFLDEMNRAPPKVTNALMEILQFKSINGKKLNNLRMVWAAINPPAEEDEDPRYHVQELDPAVYTRFQIHYSVPMELSETFFEQKFGKDITKRLVKWWDALDDKFKLEFPPRVVEYTLTVLKDGGDINDTLPNCIKKSTFLKAITEVPIAALSSASPRNPTKEIVQKNNFVLTNTTDLTKLSRDLIAFRHDVQKLSNEEFIQLFLRVGPTTGKTLSTVGQRIIATATKEQLTALAQVDYSNCERSFLLHTKRVLVRNFAKRKMPLNLHPSIALDNDDAFDNDDEVDDDNVWDT